MDIFLSGPQTLSNSVSGAISSNTLSGANVLSGSIARETIRIPDLNSILPKAWEIGQELCGIAINNPDMCLYVFQKSYS